MTTIRIQLNRDALEALQRPVVGRGGFQSLLQQLQSQKPTWCWLLLLQSAGPFLRALNLH